MKLKIAPSKLCGEVFAPPSKSFAHRMMICAALSKGDSVISGISESEDMKATLDCISALGVTFDLCGDVLKISGGVKKCGKNAVFPCRESGSTMRFFMPIALALGFNAEFTGTERLIERGVEVYEKLFSEKGCVITKGRNSVSLSGKLTSGEYVLSGSISSQYISGLMFALPLLSGSSVIRVIPPVESRPYIDITVAVLKSFGVNITETEPNVFYIDENESFSPREAVVEGDWSNGAALLAFNNIGGRVKILGLSENSLQGDRAAVKYLEMLKSPQAKIDISACPDLGPVLFAVAAASHGAAFTGTKRLAIKESSRALAMAEELIKFGIRADISENSVVIEDSELQIPRKTLFSHNDHRIVMALVLLLSITGGEIDGVQAVNKSFPNYFEELSSLGLVIENGI